jgi:hypothetical protein
MDSPRLVRLERLKEAAEVYAKSIGGLLETVGMGYAQLACMSWEERARKSLLTAIEEYDHG